MNTTCKQVCIVGAGPRGLSVLERLLANERAEPRHGSLVVHLVDPFPPGSGAVWRTEQPPHLLMNTVASQVTVFTDTSSRISGPVEPGPSLHQWARSLPGDGGAESGLPAEAAALGPDDYPSRALYGLYLRHMLDRIVSAAPAHVTVRVHRTRAVAVSDTAHVADGPQTVQLADGGCLRNLHSIVLAQGHVPARPLPEERQLAGVARAHGLTYVPPSNPADVHLDAIRPGEVVLLRGLGLNFFDYMALFTRGRGGTFHRAREGGLEYRASGREPRMYAFSRRGVPYHARGENEKGASRRHTPVLVTHERMARLRACGGSGIDFREQLWPLIAREVETVYYATLLSSRNSPADAREFKVRFLSAPEPDDRGLVLDAFRVTRAERWDWRRIADPCHGLTFADQEEFTRWLLDHLARDVREAQLGNLSGPLKAALDVLRDLRNEIRLAVEHRGLEGRSHREDLDAWYTPLNAFLSIGPPASRIEEMIALVEAGLLCVTGPGTWAGLDEEARVFAARSERVPGPPVHATALIDARLPTTDVRHTADPLLRGLIRSGKAASYRVPSTVGAPYETGGLAVAPLTCQLLDAQGHPHPRRLVYGVPTESVRWVTAAGIRPGVDSVTLADADAIARTLLGLVPALPCTAQGEHMTSPAADRDTGLLSPVRAGTRVERAVCDHAWIQAMLDAEAALARAQARLGTIPPESAQAITAAARAESVSVRDIAVASRESANPVVALVQTFTQVVAKADPVAADHVHRGSTSQDIFDTAAMLVSARALRVVRQDLRRIITALADLALRHRDTVMAGRTLAVHAVPTTFGLKAAGWLQLITDADRRLAGLLDGGLPVSLGGAAGTLAGYGEYACIDGGIGATDTYTYLDRLTAAFADEVGLARPALPWHSLRTPVVDTGAVLAFTAGALGKIAVDVLSLARTEVGEVDEPAVSGRGTSSAMPHKRNPVLATLIRSAALQVPVLSSVLGQCMPAEDERSAGLWHAEWQPLREMLRLVGGAACTAAELVEGLEIHPERMQINLQLTEGRLVSERVSARLAPALGKAVAKRVLTEASAVAQNTHTPLYEVLADVPEVAKVFDREELKALCDPGSYTGAASWLVDRALQQNGLCTADTGA